MTLEDWARLRMRREERADDESEALATAVIGAAIEVHRHIGPGLPEKVYQRALCVELQLRGVEFSSEHPLPVRYKGELVGEGRLDLLVGGKLVVELKSLDALNDIHRAQVVAYLTAMGLQLGLLINFNVHVLKDGIRRVIQSF